MPEYEYDVMLSYQSADEGAVRGLAEILEAEQIDGRPVKVWFAPWDVKPGGNIVQGINDGLANSRLIFLCLSPDALEAPWPLAEQSAAIFTDPTGTTGRVVPVILRDCRLPPLISFRRYIDLRGSKFESGVQFLLALVKDQPLPRGQASRWTGLDPPSRATAIELLSPTEPDPLPEALYTNLFPVADLPATIHSAASSHRHPKDAFRSLPYDVIPAGFVLHGGRLYSFSDLDDPANPLRRAIQTGTESAQSTDDWLNSTDERRLLVQLLNSSLVQHLKAKKWTVGSRGALYFEEANVPKDFKFKSHKGSTGKLLVRTYEKMFGGRGCKAHRAAKTAFELIDFTPYLHMESTWFFTYDGSRPAGRYHQGVLNTRFMSRQRNRANLGEVRFMAWLMSDEQGHIVADYGHQKLAIAIDPVAIKVSEGIYGDQQDLPDPKEPPDFDLESEEGEDAELAEDNLLEGENG